MWNYAPFTTEQTQACLAMTGYIVEIDAEIEETLTQVMSGVKWQTWKPYFVPESEDLVGTWSTAVIGCLNGLNDTVDKISSRALKKVVKADRIAPRTWARITEPQNAMVLLKSCLICVKRRGLGRFSSTGLACQQSS